MTKTNILNEEKTVEVSVPSFKPHKYVQGIHDAAEELYEVESQIKKDQQKFDAKMSSRLEFVQQAREKLLKMMQEARQKHVDVSDSEYVYVRVPKTSYEITDEVAAFKWASKEGLVRIDKTAANKKLLRTIKMPKGFQEVQSESLTLKATEK